MVKSKTKIEKQTKKKTNLDLVETINLAKKNENWIWVAELLSAPRRKRIEFNLDKINDEAKKGDIIAIPGKVLSQGNIDKKIKVVALGFSKTAKEKLLNSKCEAISIGEEIKKNPGAKGIKILKGRENENN